MDYKEKLKDPRWQKRKCEIMTRDNFTCQECGSKEKTLCVHHKTYENCENGDPWACPDEDLVTWCEDCHNKFHHDEKKGSIEGWLDDETFIGLYCAFSKTIHEVNEKWREEWKNMLFELMGVEFKTYYTKSSDYDYTKKKSIETYKPCIVVSLNLTKMDIIAIEKRKKNENLNTNNYLTQK